MDFILALVDFILHVDKHLVEIISDYGTWTYLILFVIIFSETGFVVTPFLPGDSLLFVIGALGAKGALSFEFALILLIVAALGGNTLNYFIGKIIGHRILAMKNSRIIKKEYLNKTHAFYAKHGGKAIIFSRFVPIIRTFAPFVAGLGKMSFLRYSIYNIIGGVSWVLLFMFAGYFFGNIPTVKDNFTYVIFAIIFVSLLPTIIPYLRSKRR
ncbi:DedA family protein [Desulfosporosinus meridiei]|uniref:Putative membrane-associated protein n=1 Tax=Desulfosporosinus meridiei (strain ATCC BAA-275 / DSM 13257 / KCTC 12902 / NCIMB 13706 / S10) TaxID=768704 RepID=J7IV65_DESMD|nr:DedA family protein [Desulfosporosinus meridiei]AFQ44044.1 putative membrane-associated protein [Desulfosporosinus meridiei DSM 13257]